MMLLNLENNNLLSSMSTSDHNAITSRWKGNSV